MYTVMFPSISGNVFCVQTNCSGSGYLLIALRRLFLIK